MVITPYQVESVLRTYSRQLQRSRFADQASNEDRPMPSERVTISEAAKERLLMDRIKCQALEHVHNSDNQDSVGELSPGKIL